jgi:integrase
MFMLPKYAYTLLTHNLDSAPKTVSVATHILHRIEKMSYEFNAFTVRDGKITLYKRNLKNSAVWQCRFMAQGKCIRRSTKESSVSAATAAAEDLYDETRFKIKNNIPIGLATFEMIWKKWIIVKQGTEKTWSVGGHRLRYANIIANAHFLPYFGKKPITAVTTANVTEYWPWRESNGRKSPSAGTLSMEAQLLKQFLKWAQDSSYIDKLPKAKSPKKVKPKDQRREAFTEDEYEALKKYMVGWIKNPNPAVAKRRRQFRNFVMVMFASGMRQNEARNLKWRDVSIKNHAVLNVSGKTGARDIIAQPEARTYLTDQKYNVSAFTKPDDYVFANPKGEATANFEGMFRTLVTGADMLLCADGSKKVIYSMRHSYCTWRLLDGDVEMDKLARNTGTSKEMIQQHYGHVTNISFADELTKTNKKPPLNFKYTVIDRNHQT